MEETPLSQPPPPPPSTLSLPVDADGKATAINPLSVSPPHMRAFHLAWLSLFACFFSIFSIPPLLPVIRADLGLTSSDVARAGVASFVGSIFSRLLMGPTCDVLGPRLASASLSLLTAPALVAPSLLLSLRSPASFAALRLLVGLPLANFVACQFWMTSMFSGSVVGQANATAAGWANMGSGLAQLIMPLFYSLITDTFHVSPSTAWRVALILPAVFQVVTAVLVLRYGVDTPRVYYTQSRTKTPPKEKENVFKIFLHGVLNYRGWIMGLLYASSYGVELTIDNMISEYFYDEFGLNLEKAGLVAASFGLANFVSRPMGGALSDAMGRRFGMRGRLWSMWVVLTVAGLLCVVLGRVGSLWGSIVVMCGFSVFVQAASGLIFGVVPFVSTRSLGVISGMTGSGGTVGAVVTQLLFFSDATNVVSTHSGISLMGLTMIVCAVSATLIYFPQSGGMFCGPSSSFAHEDYILLV